MKRAVILHGTDGSPENSWFPWLKAKLEEQGYKVWAPELPGNHTPNYQIYNDFLFTQDWDFADNIVVGHSSGAVSVLNLLMDQRCPKIKLGVMVGAWAQDAPIGMDESQFTNMFHENGFDFELIKSKADHLAFLHSDDDPYCPLEQAQYLARELDAPITVLHSAGHIGLQFTEVPELWEIIENNL